MAFRCIVGSSCCASLIEVAMWKPFFNNISNFWANWADWLNKFWGVFGFQPHWESLLHDFHHSVGFFPLLFRSYPWYISQIWFWEIAKGQYISKANFKVFIWSKKRTKNFCPSFKKPRAEIFRLSFGSNENFEMCFWYLLTFIMRP